MTGWKRKLVGLAMAWPVVVAVTWWAKNWTLAPWISLLEHLTNR